MHIEAIRDFCLSMPGVTEDIKWGADLCFSVAGKMFCITSTEAPHTVAFKVNAEEFEELVNSGNIIPAPYMARNKWVQVQAWSRFTNEQWEYYVKQSYGLVKSKLPKKVQQAIS